MAKKTTKTAPKASARPASAKSSKSTAKAAAKPAAKAPVKTAKPIAKSTAPKKESISDKKAAEKKPAAKSESSRPALMTARGKVKAEPPPAPAVKASPSESKRAAQRAAPSETSHDFESSGDQLIAMAKEEMSKINKTGDSDKSAEKTSKFKPIKIERGNLSDEKAKWQELNKRYGKEKATAYKMSESFESLKPIQHKVLGWGFVLTNDNNRLEVLFENGIKMLISNYKAN